MIYLSDRSVLRISGADAKSFLQGLCTNNVEKVSEDTLLYALMLSPQGKFLFDFFLIAEGENLLLDCAADRADELVKRLAMYKLRSDVTIENTQLKVYAGQGLADPRSSKLMHRKYSTDEREADGNLQDYNLHLLENGVPGSTDFIIDKSFPMFYGLEALNGVSFEKGCYVGQENTARMKYKGELRKGLFVVRGQGLPEFGEKIDGLGQMLSSQNGVGLALCDLADVDVYEGALEIEKPSY